MTRQETIDWVKTLKPGDTVILKDCRTFSALTVEKVTKSGRVKTTDGSVFYLSKYHSNLVKQKDFFSELVYPTEENLKIAKEQDAEQERLRTIRKAKNTAEKFLLNHNLSTETAQKIIDFLTSLESEKGDKNAGNSV